MRRRREKIAIAGWFGSENLGDELLLLTLCELLERHGTPRDQMAVICAQPERASQRHGLFAVKFPVFRGGAVSSWRSVVQLLRRTRVLLIGPGTVFQERSPNLPWPGTLVLLIRLVVLARLLGCRVELVGVGVREDTTWLGRILLRLAGHLSARIGTRDAVSAKFFGRRAMIIGDVAFASNIAHANSPVRQSRRGILISARPTEPARDVAISSALREAIEVLRGEEDVAFLCMARGHGAVGEDDETFRAKHLSTLSTVPTRPDVGSETAASMIQEVAAEVASARLLIGMRLHAVVLAVLAGTPVVAIAYERKVAVVMNQLGLQAATLDQTDLSAEHILAHAASLPDVLAVEAKDRARRIGECVEQFVRGVAGE